MAFLCSMRPYLCSIRVYIACSSLWRTVINFPLAFQVGQAIVLSQRQTSSSIRRRIYPQRQSLNKLSFCVTRAYPKALFIHVELHYQEKQEIRNEKSTKSTQFPSPTYRIYQSLFAGRTFSFLTPAADLRSSGERKNKLGPSVGLSRWLKYPRCAGSR